MFFLPLGTIPAHGKVIAQRGGYVSFIRTFGTSDTAFCFFFFRIKSTCLLMEKEAGGVFPARIK